MFSTYMNTLSNICRACTCNHACDHCVGRVFKLLSSTSSNNNNNKKLQKSKRKSLQTNTNYFNHTIVLRKQANKPLRNEATTARYKIKSKLLSATFTYFS